MTLTTRIPALAISVVSIVLGIAVAACAGRSLNLFHKQQSTNPWLLPAWPSHFDTRELQTQVGVAVSVAVLDVLVILPISISRPSSNAVFFISSALSAIAAFVALVFPSIIFHRTDGTNMDTLQSWTCGWQRASTSRGDDVPSDFSTLCRDTRFAYWSSIPQFILQLSLLVLAITTFMSRQRQDNLSSRAAKRGSRRLYDDELEKATRSTSTIPLSDVSRQKGRASFETSSVESARVVVVQTKSAGHA